jgi:hypothetical protein
LLTPIPPSRVLHEWDAISADLKKAIDRDPGRTWMTVLGQAIAGQLQFWRVGGAASGYLATQVTRQPGSLKRLFWVIYVGGRGGSLNDWRGLMAMVELHAVNARCCEVRFEGRDWRRVLPEYDAHRGDDGRWNFRKVLA